jgi:hypothetical protein
MFRQCRFPALTRDEHVGKLRRAHQALERADRIGGVHHRHAAIDDRLEPKSWISTQLAGHGVGSLATLGRVSSGKGLGKAAEAALGAASAGAPPRIERVETAAASPAARAKDRIMCPHGGRWARLVQHKMTFETQNCQLT